MPDILIRDLDETTVDLLKALAQRRGRSLQAETRLILEEAARASDWEKTRALADAIRAKLAGRAFDDSAALIREDRDR